RVKYFGKADSNEVYDNIIHMNKFFRADFNFINFRDASKSPHAGKYSNSTIAFVTRTKVPPKRISRVDINFIDVFVTPEFFSGDHEYWDAYRAGALYHEMSHLRLCTADIVYGKGMCERLARDKPAHAYRNADNYGFYCEEAIARRYGIEKPTFDLKF
ncbi:MAG: M35 family metallo-endopeptidase, partial [Pseudomonadota bacterium]